MSNWAERFGFAVLCAFGVLGFITACTVGMCYLGYSNACLIDLMPAGPEISCEKAPTKPRRITRDE